MTGLNECPVSLADKTWAVWWSWWLRLNTALRGGICTRKSHSEPASIAVILVLFTKNKEVGIGASVIVDNIWEVREENTVIVTGPILRSATG